MIVVMKPEATDEQVEEVENKLADMGFSVHFSQGVDYTTLGAIGDKSGVDPRELEVLNEGVLKVTEVSEPYKLAGRDFHPLDTVIKLNGVKVGGGEPVIMAGPCAVESREQINTIAEYVSSHGASILRGGAFKPRTSPYSFQGLGEEGLKYMREAADNNGMYVVTEVMDKTQVDLVCEYADVLQVGARNMQNYNLLREVGRARSPVLLKRGFSSTAEEFLMAAEYVMSEGNEEVILCERGIRTFSNETRFTLDLSVIPVIKELSHLPIIVDPSHSTGVRDKVAPMARAGIAAGADGMIVEVHNEPEKAKSDGPQSLRFKQFADLMDQVNQITETLQGKKLVES
ncbi:MAG: 3-deoxy-7-phosphoheptulonate synthase [Candidatus Acetothermia bacterium]|nr:3-deoxy-7-phosphoheptulonate synthase [Candidatus Bipolaricaulota bacterium]